MASPCPAWLDRGSVRVQWKWAEVLTALLLQQPLMRPYPFFFGGGRASPGLPDLGWGWCSGCGERVHEVPRSAGVQKELRFP
jgi:hypothetical protein